MVRVTLRKIAKNRNGRQEIRSLVNHPTAGVKRGVPDLKAAKRIPVEDVMDRLGIELHGSMARCWRPDNHQHGDRTPSVGIWRRRNKAKCFVCDARLLSTIDLVMSVLGHSTYEALRWLDKIFQLPRVPKGKHLVKRSQESPFRVGVTGNRLEPLVRSGLFGAMSHAEVRLLNVLDIFADPQMDSCSLSYAALRRFSGLRKDSTVAKAVRRLENMGTIAVARGRGGNGLSRCNTYKLTLEDSRFLALLRDCFNTTREKIEVQRQIRAERRSRLSWKANGGFTPNLPGRISTGRNGKPVTGPRIHQGISLRGTYSQKGDHRISPIHPSPKKGVITGNTLSSTKGRDS